MSNKRKLIRSKRNNQYSSLYIPSFRLQTRFLRRRLQINKTYKKETTIAKAIAIFTKYKSLIECNSIYAEVLSSMKTVLYHNKEKNTESKR